MNLEILNRILDVAMWMPFTSMCSVVGYTLLKSRLTVVRRRSYSFRLWKIPLF